MVVENLGTDVSFINCTNEGEWTVGSFAGGIIYYANRNITVYNCKNKANITGRGGNLAGIVYMVYNNTNTTNNIEIYNCENTGKITGERGMCAGIIAEMITSPYEERMNEVKIVNTKNKGDILGNDNYTGGIVSEIYNIKNVIIDNCINTGNVKGKVECGGIIGWMSKIEDVKISNCRNEGDIYGSEDVGGLIGDASDYIDAISMIKCTNTGSVTATDYGAGGLIGDCNSKISLNQCSNTGSITARSTAGGLIGSGSAKYNGCSSTGLVTSQNGYKGKLSGWPPLDKVE